MLRAILIFFGMVIGGMMFLHNSLQDGSAIKYLDRHPQEKWTPPAAYFLGQGYYLFQDLSQATTYFFRVAESYPASAYRDDASFYYLQCLQDRSVLDRAGLIQKFQDYLERFPGGKHEQVVRERLQSYQSDSR